MNDNLVKTLREKTEEADLDTILKTTFGGYSRKSVREYISILRQQQYDLQQSFSEEMQLSQTERDRLVRELAEANERAAAAEEALANATPLIEKAAGLEKDMDEAVERIQADAVRLEQLRQELEQQQAELLQIRNERDDLLVRLENTETAALKPEPAQPAAEPPVQTDALTQTDASGENSEKNGSADLSNPLEQPEAMQVRLAILTRERENTAKRIESFIRQEKSLFQALNECRAELENRRDQNQCMEAENKELGRRLSEQILQNISLNREITHMRTINENLKCKLEAALEESANRSTPNDFQNTEDVFQWTSEE